MLNYKYEIVRDETCENPREFANLGTLVVQKGKHRWIDKNCREVWSVQDEIEDLLVDNPDYAVRCLGTIYAYMDTETVAREFAGDKQKALACLDAELELLTAWLDGECYGYQVFETVKCNLGHEHASMIDSCYGFYSYADAKEAADEWISGYVGAKA